MMNALRPESNSKSQIEYVDLLLQDVETLIATNQESGQLIVSLNMMASSLHYLRGLITSEGRPAPKPSNPIIEPKSDRPITEEEDEIIRQGLIDIEYDYEAVVDARHLGLYAVRRAWLEMTARLNNIINKVR